MNNWEAEYQRRLGVLFQDQAKREPVGTIKIENEKGYGGYCDTCEYTFERIVLRDDEGSVELNQYRFGDFADLIEALAAVESLP